MVDGPPTTPRVVPQPGPLTWDWRVAPATEMTPDGPRPVRLVYLRLDNVGGTFHGFFQPADVERFLEDALLRVREARSGIITATELPPRGDDGRPG